jgi:hypothetical protein
MICHIVIMFPKYLFESILRTIARSVTHQNSTVECTVIEFLCTAIGKKSTRLIPSGEDKSVSV